MADQKTNNSVASAENLLAQLKQQAEQAHKSGDGFMMGVYVELIRVATPVVTKAIARYHREERARINQLRSEIRQQTRAQKPTKSEA
jgi:predicted N-acyltransferase